MPPSSRRRAVEQVTAIVAWHATQSRAARPFYCDESRIGHFAIARTALAAGTDEALFRLFITLAMFQGQRDVVVMRKLRRIPREAAEHTTSPNQIFRVVKDHPCDAMRSPAQFDSICDVYKLEGVVDCHRAPGLPCHVKSSTELFRRMGDLGKLPVSALLHFWQPGGLRALIESVCAKDASPASRARALVANFQSVYRVGVKLSSMFVSALSTPDLAPGLTPWFPKVDGNSVVVIDTNVARIVDTLRNHRSARTYAARAEWIRGVAHEIDLRRFYGGPTRFSPRIIQEALYAFGSRSNRLAANDLCAAEPHLCTGCAPVVCPFKR